MYESQSIYDRDRDETPACIPSSQFNKQIDMFA